jgi:hypothetical protein
MAIEVVFSRANAGHRLYALPSESTLNTCLLPSGNQANSSYDDVILKPASSSAVQHSRLLSGNRRRCKLVDLQRAKRLALTHSACASTAGIINDDSRLNPLGYTNLGSCLRGDTPWAFQSSDLASNEKGLACIKNPSCMPDPSASKRDSCIKCCTGK